MNLKKLFSILTLGLLLIPVVGGQMNPSPSLDARRKALNALLDEQWDYTMRSSPEYASILNDKRFNDQLTDYSADAIRKRQAETHRFLERFQAIDTTGFPEQEALSRRLMVHDLAEQVGGERFKEWEMPVNQMSGLHIDAPQLPVLLEFAAAKDYRDYISRLHRFPVQFAQVTELMRQGIKDGVMPPKFLMEKVSEQARRVAETPLADSPFTMPLKHFPDSIPAAEREEIAKDVNAAVTNGIVPAYLKFSDFVRDEYAPKGRTEFGVWSLPDGDARYAFDVKQSTTTAMTPEEIHQLGLQQVAEIETAEKAIADKLGFADLAAMRASIQTDPKLHVKSEEAILDLYRGYIDQMYTKLPALFNHLPKARVTVVAIEAYRAKESSTEYQPAAPDGSRPGRVEVNTYAWEKQTTPGMESTAYHEGVPGHHLQISIAQQLTGLPQFRRNGGYNAYVEGWALYTERLGKDIGFYQDPYSDYGRLEDEMLRAIRLVVDTGLHYKHWTRQQVVDFFHAHSNIPESLVQSETDRYISWPAQALGYKVGQLTILRLREKAKAELGDKFDIRQFHDEVLGAGALPLDVLSERIDAWIAAQKISRKLS
jgi:uncharacterized protein (DUF885 family)